jgi:hypothetical protein
VTEPPPLTSRDPEGQLYTRRAQTEVEIRHVLGQPRDTWDARARVQGPSRLSSEALVFLIRHLRERNNDLLGSLTETLNRRTLRTARRWSHGFDEMTSEHILLTVQMEVLELVFAVKPSRQSEFLEISFEQAVKRRTLNLVAKYQGYIAERPAGRAEEGGEEEALEDQVPDPGPLPDEWQDTRQRVRLMRRARLAVKDPRHYEALLLHHGFDWPLSSTDPAKQSLERHFGKSARQIQNWIQQAIKEMKDAIGESHD